MGRDVGGVRGVVTRGGGWMGAVDVAVVLASFVDSLIRL